MWPVSWETGNTIRYLQSLYCGAATLLHGNPSGLTERDARIYSQYLQTEHKGFVKLAEELAADR